MWRVHRKIPSAGSELFSKRHTDFFFPSYYKNKENSGSDFTSMDGFVQPLIIVNNKTPFFDHQCKSPNSTKLIPIIIFNLCKTPKQRKTCSCSDVRKEKKLAKYLRLYTYIPFS